MTTVYFIRHAQSDPSHRDDRTRPLTEAGLRDTKLITACIGNRGISHILSSPYQRTLDTVAHLAETLALPVETDEDFRERDAGGWHGDNFLDFVRAQWEDFDYRTENGESLAMVQKRNVAALERVMRKYHGQTIAIATHGTALGTILNHYDPNWSIKSFLRILNTMPYVIRLELSDDGTKPRFSEILRVEKHWRKNG